MKIPEFMAQPGDMVKSIFAPNDPPYLVVETYRVMHGSYSEDGYRRPKWYYMLLFVDGDVIRVPQTNWKRVD